MIFLFPEKCGAHYGNYETSVESSVILLEIILKRSCYLTERVLTVEIND